MIGLSHLFLLSSLLLTILLRIWLSLDCWTSCIWMFLVISVDFCCVWYNFSLIYDGIYKNVLCSFVNLPGGLFNLLVFFEKQPSGFIGLLYHSFYFYFVYVWIFNILFISTGFWSFVFSNFFRLEIRLFL